MVALLLAFTSTSNCSNIPSTVIVWRKKRIRKQFSSAILLRTHLDLKNWKLIWKSPLCGIISVSIIISKDKFWMNKYYTNGILKFYRFKKTLVESCQDLARCCQHLNFGLNWTEGVKAKHCRALSTNFQFNVKLIQSKKRFSQ